MSSSEAQSRESIHAGPSTCPHGKPEAESKAADTPQLSGPVGLLRVLPLADSHSRRLFVQTINAGVSLVLPTNTINLGLRNT